MRATFQQQQEKGKRGGEAEGESGGWEGGTEAAAAAMATPTAFQLSVRAYPADNKQSAQQAKQPDVPMHHAPCLLLPCLPHSLPQCCLH